MGNFAGENVGVNYIRFLPTGLPVGAPDGTLWFSSLDNRLYMIVNGVTTLIGWNTNTPQYFKVSYTFTASDQSNGYAFVPCKLPVPYADADYVIQVTLQNNNVGGGWLTLGYVGGDGPAHGTSPTPTDFSVVLLGINSTGMVAGQAVILHCTTFHS